MDQHVAIRLREASDIEVRIEFAYEHEHSAATELAGTISGPRLDGSRTLPATVPLRPTTKDSAPAAEAILPDPCYWSPEMPFLYDVSLELIRAGEFVDSATFSIALHPKRAVKQ